MYPSLGNSRLSWNVPQDVPYIANFIYENPGIIDLNLRGISIADPSLSYDVVQDEIPALRFARVSMTNHHRVRIILTWLTRRMRMSFPLPKPNGPNSKTYQTLADILTILTNLWLTLPLVNFPSQPASRRERSGLWSRDVDFIVLFKKLLECAYLFELGLALTPNHIDDVFADWIPYSMFTGGFCGDFCLREFNWATIRVTDTWPSLWSVLGFPESTQQFIYFNR